MTNLVAAVLLAISAEAAVSHPVVINEIYYNAPDDRERVQWIELHNQSAAAVDVAGWTIDEGKVLALPVGASIPPRGYLIVALDADEFAAAYPDAPPPAALLTRALKRGGEKLELRTATGQVVDRARFKDEAPWPSSADGRSASLERICPNAPGDLAENWGGSPLPDLPQPSGTPGARNTNYAQTLPPVVEVQPFAAIAAPAQALAIKAQVRGAASDVGLLYRTVRPDNSSDEAVLPMRRGDDGAWAAEIPPQPAGTLVRYRVRAAGADGTLRFAPAESDLRPAFSTYVHAAWQPLPVSRAILLLSEEDREGAEAQHGGGRRWFFGGRDQGETPRAPLGRSALVHVAANSTEGTLFDHIHAIPRTHRPGSGFILHFQKDRAFNGQTAASLLFEGIEQSLVAESLAYDLYRRAGNAAPLTEFMRLTVDGQPRGTHLLIERPNKGFLRRNKIDPGGNLYKIIWYGNGLIGTHEKKTNVQGGHEDLEHIVARLDETAGDPNAQWELIRAAFDVDQVATHFAANMVLSHWDGYFNNYFAYHDTKRDKWVLFPWDHDGAWGGGERDGRYPLSELPLDFGTEAAIPPGESRPIRGLGFGGGNGPRWWRPGGVFSNPLLANPHFRKVFLAKTRAILERQFTPEIYDPLIDELTARLAAEAPADSEGDFPFDRWQMAGTAEELKAFVRDRREFLLGQEELR
ncbi:MAG: CotH kinase family protein [Pirellulales bacterium]